MCEQLRESTVADAAESDPFVPVVVRSATVLGVVGVYEPEPIRPGDLDQPVEHRGGAARLVQRRAGREYVTGVEADPGHRMAIEGVEIGPEIVDAGAQRSALTRGRLQEQPRAVRTELLEQRQQSLAYLAHRGLVAAVVHAGAGVDHEAPGSDHGSPPEVVCDRSHGELVRLGCRAADVDQERRVYIGRDVVAVAGRPE